MLGDLNKSTMSNLYMLETQLNIIKKVIGIITEIILVQIQLQFEISDNREWSYLNSDILSR
jgi:hypothetical protein